MVRGTIRHSYVSIRILLVRETPVVSGPHLCRFNIIILRSWFRL